MAENECQQCRRWSLQLQREREEHWREEAEQQKVYDAKLKEFSDCLGGLIEAREKIVELQDQLLEAQKVTT